MGVVLIFAGLAGLAGLACAPRPAPPAPARDLAGPPAVDAAGAQAREFALRSEVALARGDTAEATRWATWLLRVDPSPPGALHAADVLRQAGAFDRAEQAAVRAVTAGGGAEAHRMLGWVRLARGDAAGADRALSEAGDLPGVREAQVAAAVALGELDVAGRRLDAWAPATPAERLGWARSALRAGRAVAARDAAVGLVVDPVVGPDALEVAVRAGAAACDPRPVHALAEAHPGLLAEPRWRAGFVALAELTGDGALAQAAIARSGGRVEAVLDGASDVGAVAAWADGQLAAGQPEAVLARTAPLDRADPTIAWVEAGALVLLGRVDEAAARVVTTAADDADAAVREAAVRSLAGEDAAAERILRAALDRAPAGSCPVPLWLAAAEVAPDCEAAGLLRAAGAVRLADGALAAAAAGAQERCAALRGP